MTKVTFLVSRVVRTGPNTNMMALLRHLPPLGIRAEVITLDPGSDPDMCHELDELGVPLVLVPPGPIWSRLRALRKLLEDGDSSVFLSCGIRADLFGLLIGLPDRHGVIKQEPAFTPFGGRAKTTLVRVLHLGIISRARSIVSVSRHVQDTLPRVVRRRSVVIPNAVDLEHFRPPSRRERLAARASVGVDDSTEVVVFAGTLDHRKRPHLLLPALRSLAQDGTRSVALVVAGDGPLRGEIEQAARDLPLRVVGFRDDVRSVFWSGDAFALLSTHEGLPLAAMEALACGLPLLLSDIPPHLELLDGAPDAGCAVRAEDPNAVVASMSRVLGLAGSDGPRRLAEERFSAASMASAYGHLLRAWPA